MDVKTNICKEYVSQKKENILCNNPINVAFSVLELNEVKLYVFHYSRLKKHRNDVKLLFPDTDLMKFLQKNYMKIFGKTKNNLT